MPDASLFRRITMKMDMAFNSETRDSLAHALARDCNSFVIATASTTTATVADSTTEITTEVRHDGPRE
jgi:hypothetical protein